MKKPAALKPCRTCGLPTIPTPNGFPPNDTRTCWDAYDPVTMTGMAWCGKGQFRNGAYFHIGTPYKKGPRKTKLTQRAQGRGRVTTS